MKAGRYYNRFLSILLIFLMIFQIIPKEVFAKDEKFSISYDSAGSSNVNVKRAGEIKAPWNEALPNYYAEIDNSANEIYINFDSEKTSIYDITGPNGIDNIPKNTWIKVNLNNFPFYKDGYPDINDEDSDKYRSITVYDYDTNINSIILIHLITSSGGETDKKNLEYEISRVTGDNEKNWHKINDKYNGKDYKQEGSFWAYMQQILFEAQNINNSHTATQLQIDSVTLNLQQAISKLIPSSNINATELYEEINTPPKKPLVYPDYTKEAWNLYNDELDKAKNLMNSLYDGNGKPTEKNKSSDTELVSEIKGETDTLKNVKLSMDPLLGFDDKIDARLKYQTLGYLLKTYNSAGYNQNLYTAESWDTFLDARRSVEEYISSNSSPGEEVGKKEYDELKNLYRILWRGIHGLRDVKDSITVTIKVVDTLGVRSGHDLNECSGIHRNIVLNGDKKTLDSAIDSLNNEVLSSYNNIYKHSNYLYATAINGILTTGGFYGGYDVGRGIAPLKFRSPEIRDPNMEKSYYDIQLHEKDVVTLAFLDQPTVPSSSGTGNDAVDESELHSHYKQTRILKDGKEIADIIEVDEGQDLELSAVYTLPHISTHSLREYSLEGATVFVSNASSTAEAVSPSGIKTDTVTDKDGAFKYAFYTPGYYALSVHDLRNNNYKSGSAPGMTIGDTVLVHVNSITLEQVEAVKNKYKEELNSVYSLYPESFFIADDWIKIKDFQEKGINEIDGASTSEAARKAYDKAIKGIKAIHDKTTGDNTEKLSELRAVLSRLPNDASLLGQKNGFLAEAMIIRYNAMSEYQKNQLTGMESAKYAALKGAYDNGLPELEPYKLKLMVKADSPEAKATIENMLGYIFEHGENTDLFYNFKIAERNIDGTLKNGKISPRAYAEIPQADVSTKSSIAGYVTSPTAIGSVSVSAYPDNYICFAPALDIFVHDFDTDISGDNWEILNDDVIEQNTLIKGRTVRIGKIPYEIKKIQVSGVENINTEKDSIKAPNGKDIVFLNAYKSFIMPYEDVTVTVTWGIADGNIDPDDNLALAKINAIEEIKNAFYKYKSYEYTEDGWTEIVSSKNTGLDEVAKATSAEEITAARDKSISAMASVTKKVIGGNIPDFGRILGKVDLYLENTTFRGGAFTGTILDEPGFDYAEKDTMMTIILRALAENGFGWTGQGGKTSGGVNDYSIEYISTINKDEKSMGEFSGEPGSGWMGTLNDFFVNEGFQHFSVRNGKISDGDEIRVMFTQNLGVDLGGTWGNSDTSLTALKLSSGKLYPSFNSNINTYTLVLSSGTGRLKVTPTASNKNYMVKTFLNDKVTDNKEGASFYKRTQNIPVRPGDYINVGVGEYAWPSMNKQETEARSYSGTWYRLNIITPENGASHVISLIDTLPSKEKITLLYEDTVKNIKDIYEILTSSEKSKITNMQKLRDAESRIAFFKEIEAVKVLLKKIPSASKISLEDKAAVMAADEAYKKLTDEQKMYITVGDVKNYNAAIDKLKELGAFKSGNVPSKIKGNEEIPEIKGNTIDIKAETKIINKTAVSKVTSNQIKEALKEINDKDVSISGIAVTVDAGEDILKSDVEISKSSINDISKEKLDLHIQTPLGVIIIPSEVLGKISEKAEGSNINIILAKADVNKLTEKQKSAAKENQVYDISILSSDKAVSGFGGQTITISLPYKLKKGQIKNNVSVWYLNDKGEQEKLNSVYDEETSLATFKTDHLSYYMIGYENIISFVDVNEKDWFYDSVMYTVQKGLFSGTDETRFSPNSPMTRAMLVTVLHRLEGKTSPTLENKFKDVNLSEWYTDAIRWSSENDIVRGITDTEFMPQKNITREQLAVMLYRYARIKGMNTEVKGNITDFTDSKNISSWAIEAINWATENKLVAGRENGMLDPAGNATRAEVAAILERFITKIIK